MKTIATRARRAKLAEQNASPRQRAELARRKRMGVGMIEKPLRFIGSRTNSVGPDRRGAMVPVLSSCYELARGYANDGNGYAVRSMAREVLQS